MPQQQQMKSGFQTGTDDPFAGLESAPITTPIASVAASSSMDNPLAASTSSAVPHNKPPMAKPSPQLANIFSDKPGGGSTSTPATVGGTTGVRSPSPIMSASPKTMSMSASNNNSSGVRSPSPVVLPPATAAKTMTSPSPAMSVRKTVDIPAPIEIPAPEEVVGVEVSASSSGDGDRMKSSAVPSQTSTVTASSSSSSTAKDTTPKVAVATTTPRESSNNNSASNVSPKKTPPPRSTTTTASTSSSKATTLPSKPPPGGIGKSGAHLPESANMTTALQSSSSVTLNPNNARFFNIYEFLAGADKKEPTRKFYPIERVKPFWALMGLDVYVEKWRLDNNVKIVKGGVGAFLGAAGASLMQGGSADEKDNGSSSIQKSSSHDNGGKDGGNKKGSTTTPETAAFTAAPMYEQLSKALSFQCHLVQESERNMYSLGGKTHPLEYLRGNQIGLEACIKLISMLPHSAGASGKNLDALFLNFINTYVNLVGNLQENQQLVLPGGWQTLDSAHVCLYILRNRGSTYSFSVVNTGPAGLEYHPSNFDSTTGRQTKQLCLTIWDIPKDRVTDSTFWVLLFRMQVYPSKRNSAEFLYTKLLTSLNSRPLLSNKDSGPAEFFYPPATASAASQYHQLALLALTTIPELNSPSSKYSQLLVRNAAVEIAYRGIADARPSSMDPEDSRILQLTARNLSNYASTLDPKELGMLNGGGDDMNALGGALNYTWELLDRLLGKLAVASSKPLDQHSAQIGGGGDEQFGKGMLKNLRADEGSAAHPFFGRLRRDNYDEVVKALMGDPRPDPILIPAVLTDEGMPDVATDYHTAASSLLRICHACSLLLQQRRLVKNAPAFVASAAQHALTVTLPLPHLDSAVCFCK